jgi:flavin-dependent dehydrogenase
MLVCADGSPSNLARKLGLVKNEPDSFCSRQYIKAGTHNFGNMDGVCFYPRALLPGYAAIFAEADGDVNYLCYIIPGGQMGEKDLASVHEDLAKNDPNISKLLGPNYEPRERMKGASLRLGGIEKSVAENCIVIGDACGMIDPLTGGKCSFYNCKPKIIRNQIRVFLTSVFFFYFRGYPPCYAQR